VKSINITVTDGDIDAAEKALGLKSFDDQRRKVLKCVDSVDVQACPGSGKTTVVIAKLIILAHRWPERHRGICVLSHTNVARAEIQNRIHGTSAASILGYPHFVGTIQSFVDRFLGTAAAIAKFGKRPIVIDSEWAGRSANRFLADRSYSTAANWLKCRPNSADKIVYGLRFEGPELRVVSDGGNLTADDTKSCKDLSRLKETLAKRGIYGYPDMFALAEWYLGQSPRMKEVLSWRFPFVLLDEMQDTNDKQWRVLSSVFDEQSVTIQRFGDGNQAIFDGSGVGSAVSGFPMTGALPMDTSYRFSNRIALAVRSVCPKPHAELRGNADQPDHNPRLILFSASKVREVIPAYAEWVFSKHGQAAVDDKHGVHVLGRIGKKNDSNTYTLPDYWPTFDGSVQHPNRRLPNLQAYVESARSELDRTKSLGAASHVLLDAMAEALRIQDVVRPNGNAYTANSLLAELRDRSRGEHQVAQTFLMKVCRQLAGLGNDDLANAPAVVRNILAPLLPGGLSKEAAHFLDSTNGDQILLPPGDPTANYGADANIYIYKNGNISLPVRVGTIHAAKGQTHLATLVVETFYKEPDLPKVLPYFIGKTVVDEPDGPRLFPYSVSNDPPGAKDGDLERLKLAYVGITRPKSLLAIAVDSTRITVRRQAFEEHDWDIVELK